MHHYTNFMEREEFDQAFETVNSLIKDYIHLDMLQPGCRKSALHLENISLSYTVLGHSYNCTHCRGMRLRLRAATRFSGADHM